MPLWFSLAVYGTNAYAEAVERSITTLLRAPSNRDRPYLELVRRPELSIVVFRRRDWSLEDYNAWSTDLLAAQRGFVTRPPGRAPPPPASHLAPRPDMAMLEGILAPWPELRSAVGGPRAGVPGWRMASPPRGASARRCPRVPRAPRGSPERP